MSDIKPVAWRLRNTSFRVARYEYFETRELAIQRQADFNRSVDDGSLLELTPLVELEKVQAELDRLRERVRAADAADRALNEALNMGDGVYRP